MNNVPRTEEKILLKGAPCEAGGVALAEPIVIPLLLAARLGRWTDKEGTREGKGKGQWHVKADLSWIRLGIRITIVAATAIGLLRTSDHPRELSSPLTNSPIPSPLSLSLSSHHEYDWHNINIKRLRQNNTRHINRNGWIRFEISFRSLGQNGNTRNNLPSRAWSRTWSRSRLRDRCIILIWRTESYNGAQRIVGANRFVFFASGNFIVYRPRISTNVSLERPVLTSPGRILSLWGARFVEQTDRGIGQV